MADDKIIAVSSSAQAALEALGGAEMGEVKDKVIVVSTRKDQLSIDDEVFKFGMKGVILAVAWQRGYYDTKYNPNQKESEASPPVCYSISRGRYLFLAPEQNALKPQATNCEECPQGDIMFKQRAEIERRDGSFHGPNCKARAKIIFLRLDEMTGRLLGSLHLLQTYPTAAQNFVKYQQFCKDAFGSAAGTITNIELSGKEMTFTSTGPITSLGEDALQLAVSKLEAARKTAYQPIVYKTKTEEVGQTPEEIKAEQEKKATAKARSKI